MKPKYFHGGNRKLQIGDFVLPPTETGVSGMAASNPLCRKDRVYITPEIVDAQFFASAANEPVVYEVVPEGELEPDPDCNKPGGSFACVRAKVIAIRKIPGKVIKKNRKMMLRRSSR